MRNFLFLNIFLLLYINVSGQIQTYPAPSNVIPENDFIMPSDQYKVLVIADGEEQESFTYMMHAMQYTNNCLTTSWTNFSFDGTVLVRVYKLQGTIDECHILPSSANISPSVYDNYIEFEISEPGQYSVEFETGIKITHPMLVFADPPEQIIPDPDDPDVICFEPGFHDIGDAFYIPSGKTVYLAPGAYLTGQFYSDSTEQIRILGRGILSGENYPVREGNHMITMHGTNNLFIEGITIIHAPRFMIWLSGYNHHIKNVKMIGWWFSTDGIMTGNNGLIEDCFFKVNDDAIKLYASNTTAHGCVIWQMENGAPFQIGWGGEEDNANFYAYDCDIIRVEHEWDNENLAVFCAIHGARGHKKHYLYEDIRIENSIWRIFRIVTKPNRWVEWDPNRGNLSNITFRNIDFKGSQKVPSLIRGWDENHKIRNISIENLKINGEYIHTAEEGNIFVDPETTENVRVIVNK